MAQELDEELATWRSQPLEIDYPYLVVDAHSPEGHASRPVTFFTLRAYTPCR
jgi:hypothetical protein